MAQVADLIQEEISSLFRKGMKDPRLGFVTITEVEVTPDLRYAKIFVSVLGSEEEVKDSLKALASASGFLRHELGQRLRLRYIPELSFILDTSIERGDRILRLLKEVEEGDQEHPGAPGAEEGKEESGQE
jgi:ribosome-binding factor A